MFYIKTNFQSYIDGVNKYAMLYPLIIPQNAINGPLQDSFWQEVDHYNLQSNLNGVITGRIFIFNNEKEQIIILIEKTKSILPIIESSIR